MLVNEIGKDIYYFWNNVYKLGKYGLSELHV